MRTLILVCCFSLALSALAKPIDITCTVLDPDGKPVAGALVISAEAGMSALAATDEAGEFTLTDQPAGEITLLAAKERSFAALPYQPGGAALLTLAPAPPQPPQDIARGAQLLEELLQETAGKRYYARDALPFELLPYDRERAKELLPAVGGPLAGYALAQSGIEHAAEVSREEIDECLEQIAQMNELSMQLQAYARVGTALAERDPALARELYTLANDLAEAGRDGVERAFDYTSLAILALKLKLDEAGEWIEQAMRIVRGMKDGQGLGSAIAEGLAEVDPQKAVELAKSLPINEHSAPMALARVIEIIARRSAGSETPARRPAQRW